MLEKLAAKSDNNKIAIAEEGAIPIMMKVCVRHHRVDICITALAFSLYHRTHMLSVLPVIPIMMKAMERHRTNAEVVEQVGRLTAPSAPTAPDPYTY
jgi:hypothetical protein